MLFKNYTDPRVWFKCQGASEGFDYKFFKQSLDADFVIVRNVSSQLLLVRGLFKIIVRARMYSHVGDRLCWW